MMPVKTYCLINLALGTELLPKIAVVKESGHSTAITTCLIPGRRGEAELQYRFKMLENYF